MNDQRCLVLNEVMIKRVIKVIFLYDDDRVNNLFFLIRKLIQL